jgi:hypothetical protein
MDSGSNPEARTRPRFTDGIGVGLGVGLGLGDRIGDGVGLDLGVGLEVGRGHVESAVYSESESGWVMDLETRTRSYSLARPRTCVTVMACHGIKVVL